MYRDKKTNNLVFSPTDLTRYWESEFVSWMDRCRIECPGLYTRDEDDATSRVLQTHGYQHEEATIGKLQARGLSVFTVDPKSETAAADTIAAMQRGEDIIFQAKLERAPFAGLADFLIKIPGKSRFGDWHYEIWDTKLSRKMKPYFIIQLAAYAEMIEQIQGLRPEHVGIILGTGEEQKLRLDDYFYYYLEVKNAFLSFQAAFDPEARPDPEKYRQYGNWETEAQKMIAAQDALIQVAGLNAPQVKNLKRAGIMTMTALAETTLPSIPRMADAIFERLKIQARLQIESKGKERPSYIVRTDNTDAGLYLLPPASPGDVYFDMEGFPLAKDGLEYLWGNTYLEGGRKCFKDFWAHDRAQEKLAFEGFIDWVYARWQKWPDMHIYHYANYEVAALRRLMGAFASREEEVDQLLRNEVFVDLYAIVRHGLYVGEPRYSIKNIEHLYRAKREGDVTDGGASIEFYQNWITNKDGDTWESSKILKAIRDYNIDDCDSTCELAHWLRERQREAAIPAYERAEKIAAPAAEIEGLADLQAALSARKEEQPLAELLLHLTDFYRREDKPVWWKYFDRLAMLPEELYYDGECLEGLTASDDAERIGKRFARSYVFDAGQECKLEPGTDCVHHGDKTKKVVLYDISYEDGTAVLTATSPDLLPDQLSAVPMQYLNKKGLIKAVHEFCDIWLREPERKHAVTDFLMRRAPRLTGHKGGAVINPENPVLEEAVKAALAMDQTTLCIQGPPGTGKTYTAEYMILALIEKGCRIGITSTSHKAINNLLIRAAERCAKAGIKAEFVKIASREEPEIDARSDIKSVSSAGNITLTRDLKVIGGTAWAFASDKLASQLDYLFVDEAGQMSIANLVAVGRATRNIIIMGDQMQLAQPIQGSHPGDSGRSVLDYYLQEHPTIPDGLGIFLPVSYRMHPDVCDFISLAVYENRLKSAPECARQSLDKEDLAKCRHRIAPTGLTFVSVEHEGNIQASDEECETITEIYSDFIGRKYVNAKGEQKTITPDDILIVAPYNLQVRKLKNALGAAARIGSVDKFQGQEAPVVILSMCTSDGTTSPRGIEFLFSKNRLNVAVSRAQIAAVVVGHPRLSLTHATGIDQIAQVNMFCMMRAFARGK